MAPSISEAKDAYEVALQGPEGDQILTWIEFLRERGFQRDLALTNPKAEERIQEDWIEDLSEFPADLVEEACRRWRRGNHNRAPYASGELMESVKPEFVRRKSLYMKAKSVLEIVG